MAGLTPAHLLIILVIALVVIGPGKLPEVGAAIGKSVREFQKASTGALDQASANVPTPAQQFAPQAPMAPPAPPQAAQFAQPYSQPGYAPQPVLQQQPVYPPQYPPQGYVPPQAGYVAPSAPQAVAPDQAGQPGAGA